MSRICIIDDDEAVRDSLGILLEACGFAVVAFASALTFLAADHSSGYLCLLVDVHMPGMNGLELLEVLRARGWETPAIIITGAGDDRLREAAKRIEQLTFLDKPVDGNDLVTIIDRIRETSAA